MSETKNKNVLILGLCHAELHTMEALRVYTNVYSFDDLDGLNAPYSAGA
jgi:hypothetical protein